MHKSQEQLNATEIKVKVFRDFPDSEEGLVISSRGGEWGKQNIRKGLGRTCAFHIICAQLLLWN